MLFLLFFNDIKSVFRHWQCSLFADDLKLYSVIHDFNDCLKLETDLDNCVNWYEANDLSVNINKCFQNKRSRSKRPVNFTYKTDNKTLIIIT